LHGALIHKKNKIRGKKQKLLRIARNGEKLIGKYFNLFAPLPDTSAERFPQVSMGA
jgi:hypothetical protein